MKSFNVASPLNFLLVHIVLHTTAGLSYDSSDSSGEGLPPLNTSSSALSAAAEDWGHRVSHVPRGVYHPSTAGEIAALLKAAAIEHVQVAARGRGHSALGQPQVDDGVVIDMSGLTGIGSVEEDGGTSSIWVGAGTTWREVAAALLPTGLLPPVFTDYIDLSIGGTLTVGGVGSQSPFQGIQTDNVLALEVATVEGHVVVCSSEERSDLFDAVRGGLGQFGVITKAKLVLHPAPARVRYARALYSSLSNLIEDMFDLIEEGRVAGVEGFVVPSDPDGLAQATGNAFPDAILPLDQGPFAYTLEAYHDTTAEGDPLGNLRPVEDGLNELLELPMFAYLARLDPVEAAMRNIGLWFVPHPWIDVFVPRDESELFIENELSLLGPNDVLGPILIYPERPSAINTPNFPLPNAEDVILFALLRNAVPPTPEHAAELCRDNIEIYRRCLGVGGTGYAIDAVPLDPEAWEQHFGEDRYEELRNLKEEYDPCSILTPGQNVFSDGDDSRDSEED